MLAAAEENFLQYLKLNNGVQLSITDTEKGKRGCFQTKDLSQGLNWKAHTNPSFNYRNDELDTKGSNKLFNGLSWNWISILPNPHVMPDHCMPYLILLWMQDKNGNLFK